MLTRYSGRTFARETPAHPRRRRLLRRHVSAHRDLVEDDAGLVRQAAQLSERSELEQLLGRVERARHGLSLGAALVNSAVITVGSVVALILIGALAAYALARRESKLSTGVYILFLLGIIVPWELGLVPVYVAMRHLHLIGTCPG